MILSFSEHFTDIILFEEFSGMSYFIKVFLFFTKKKNFIIYCNKKGHFHFFTLYYNIVLSVSDDQQIRGIICI